MIDGLIAIPHFIGLFLQRTSEETCVLYWFSVELPHFVIGWYELSRNAPSKGFSDCYWCISIRQGDILGPD